MVPDESLMKSGWMFMNETKTELMIERKWKQAMNQTYWMNNEVIWWSGIKARKMAVGARMNEMNVGARKTKLNEWLMK